MTPAWIVRYRPTGPWRLGPSSGARDRVDRVLHSDTVFSAVTASMARLGRMAEWLEATVHSPEPAVRISSGFPFQGDVLYAPPPRTLWPPAPSPKVRWKAARFVPLDAVRKIVSDRPLLDTEWFVDGASGCLLPSGKNRLASGPFRIATRGSASVDRLTGSVAPFTAACLEFAPGAGIWLAVGFADEAARNTWSGAVRGALRLLADSGFGGERSRGWGRSEMPDIVEDTPLGFIHAGDGISRTNGGGDSAGWSGRRGAGHR